MYDCYWMLEYADGKTYREESTGSSIRVAAPNASMLYLVTPGNEIAAKVRLFVEGQAWKPVFYRIRSMAATGIGVPQTECAVFGRARESDNEVEATLLCARGHQIGPVPEEFLDKGAITNQCLNTWTAPVALIPV